MRPMGYHFANGRSYHQAITAVWQLRDVDGETAQMLAGASGPVLDIFYVPSAMNKEEINSF